MLDMSDATFKQLPAEFFKDLPTYPDGRIDNRAQRDAMQQACDAVQPDRTKHGPVFIVGEEIELRGAKFRVHAMSGGRLYLDAIKGGK